MNPEDFSKIQQIVQHLEQSYDKRRSSSSSAGYVIGLFTTLQQTEIAWIDTELRRVGEHVKDIRFVGLPTKRIKDLEKAISECTFCIYISNEQTWKKRSSSDRKKTLSVFEKKTPTVLIVDMEDSSEEEKNRMIKNEPSFKKYGLGLFLFPKIEAKSDNPQDIGFNRNESSFRGGTSEKPLSVGSPEPYKNPAHSLPQPTPEMDTGDLPKINQIRQRLDQIHEKKRGRGPSDYVIGIFSTLPQSEIAWIETELRRVGEHIKEIKYISLSDLLAKDLEKAISGCTFCLYISTEHKWKHIATPSDRKRIFSRFGKKIPIVLIIDMVDSSEEEKNRIIKEEPKLKKYILDLFLFRKKEEKPVIAQDDGVASGDRNSFQGEFYENKSPTLIPDIYRNPRYHLPQPTLVANGTGHQTEMPQRLIDRKHIIGIFSRSGEPDYAWLVRHLKEAFQDFVEDVKCCSISNYGDQQFRDGMSLCTFGILYHTTNRGRVSIIDVKESLYEEELPMLSSELGRKNIIVLIDDLRDSSDEEKTHILETQPSIDRLACDLILISALEKENKLKLMTKLKSLKYNLGGKTSLYEPRQRMSMAIASKSTVAIFSRSEESDYSWLSQQFSSADLEVRSYKISPLNKDQLKETAFQCKLAILYHNMHDGKLRLTDTNDAMYHEELETLSSKFGKRKVIVVIDDLVESNDTIKSEILTRQPSTKTFAKDIFLFSMDEKKSLNRKDESKDGRIMMDKINAIKEMLSK